MILKELSQKVYECAVNHGFWNGIVNIPEKLCLIHSEVSEALEDYRELKMKTELNTNNKPIGFPSELADIIIRVCDLAQFLEIDLDKEIEIKHQYNLTRPYKHKKIC